jgi:hypothetical protein
VACNRAKTSPMVSIPMFYQKMDASHSSQS